MADDFVRVRLARIEELDLRLFDFDLDLTMMVFFLHPKEKVYARYGGRISAGPDERQSLASLRATMESVLKEHRRREPRFASSSEGPPRTVADIAGRRRGCMHCHQVKERLIDRTQKNRRLSLEEIYRYPPPENLGIEPSGERGNRIARVTAGSPAAVAGIKSGDVLDEVNGVPIHSYGDVQWALDQARGTESIRVAWWRENERMSARLSLPRGWRKSDITWRSSLIPYQTRARLFGPDLTAEEKRQLGLAPRQLAFRQRDRVSAQAAAAGIKKGDIILGFDDHQLEMTAYDFLTYVPSHWVTGEIVTVHLIRDGRRMRLKMEMR